MGGSVPILESKGMHAIFQEKGKKGQKRAKYFNIWANIYKIWKYFEKGQPHACDYCMHAYSLPDITSSYSK